MIATIYPSKLSGRVQIPASKSVAHRMLIAAALSDKPTRLVINAMNRDIEATMDCLRALGADITAEGNAWQVTPIAKANDTSLLDCAESGSTLRFMLPVAAALNANATFMGHGRLPERPNHALTDALRTHGAQIDSDLLPMRISGELSGGIWELPGNISSQYITGLMLALPLLSADSDIYLLTPLESASYVRITLAAIAQFGIRIETTPAGWHIPGGQSYHSPGTITVEGDWSSAAFWLAANAMGSNIEVEGLIDESEQGDRAMMRLLGLSLIDAQDTPDLVPALAIAAAALPQCTTIIGAERLRLKESDRLIAIADMLYALGGCVTITNDGLIIDGGRPLHGGTVNGVNDHRIVMAAAIAATIAEGPVRITDSQAVEKSYPDFFRDFRQLGGRVDVE